MGDCFAPLGPPLLPMGLDGADRQTDGHGNSMTESAQWGQFSENVNVPSLCNLF